jgi:XTP/dITP diphosphohydrolase/tetrapyrrole methylase family protein/MazG family protein
MGDQIQTRLREDALSVEKELLESFARFVGVVRRLRKECPWDRKQTHESIQHLLIEEAYETLDAIEKENWDELSGELGDLALHVVFHAVIAREDDRFSLREILEGETEKLVRRHPHVYGSIDAEDPETVLRNWERIKREERAEEDSILSGVPETLPALLRAQRVQEKAAGVGFDFGSADGAFSKVSEELRELEADVIAGDQRQTEAEFGDLLFALVNYARFVGIVPEIALQRTNEKFTRRFKYIEQRLKEEGRGPYEATLEEMDALWEEAKEKSERGSWKSD